MTDSSRFPELPQPNNLEAIKQTFEVYRRSLALMTPAQLTAHLTDINSRLELQQKELLARTIQAPLSEYISKLDAISLRSTPAASPRSAPPRDRGQPASPLSPNRLVAAAVLSTQGRLGRKLAAQLVAKQQRSSE